MSRKRKPTQTLNYVGCISNQTDVKMEIEHTVNLLKRAKISEPTMDVEYDIQTQLNNLKKENDILRKQIVILKNKLKQRNKRKDLPDYIA